MYSVHGLGIATPQDIPVANSRGQTFPVFLVLPSTYQVHFQQILYILRIAQCCIGTNYAIVQYSLILTCQCTYHLVQQVMILGLEHMNLKLEAVYNGLDKIR